MLRITNPATETTIREIETDTENTVADKYKRARAAQKAWQQTPLSERIKKIDRFAQLLLEKRDELAQTLTDEMGKPIKQARGEIKATAQRIEFFAKNVGKVVAEELVSDSGEEVEERIEHEPLGVIANISAWNYPYFVGSNVFVPALLCGNAVLYKPSEFATLSGLAMARLMHEAGVPSDIFVPVVGDGAIGACLVAQPIDGVYFTGSHATGKKIAESLKGRLIKSQFELGGKDPAYVCSDANLNRAAHALADGAFFNTGQSCCSIERIYVEKSVYEHFVDRFVSQVKTFKVGDPKQPDNFIGPLTRKQQLGFLTEQVDDAVKQGARVLLGGKPVGGQGNFFEPTVLVNVNHKMSVMRDESFGPIIGIMPVTDDDEAISMMADTEYGLTAAVFSESKDRAKKILSQLEVGSAYWNCCDRVSSRLPWTGRKHSGIGSTQSLEGIRTFLRPKSWHLAG